MALKIDLNALQQELEAARNRTSRSTREKALTELQDVISPDLTIEKLYGFIHLLCETDPHVAEHVSSLTLAEVLGHTSSRPSIASKQSGARRKRASREEIQAGYQAIMTFVSASKAKLSKSQILEGVTAENADVTQAIFDASWNAARAKLKKEGDKASAVYFYAGKRAAS